MHTSEHIRFLNEATFQEASPPTDRTKPLEWRRSFNIVNFELKNPTVDSIYSVNEVNFLAGFQKVSDDEAPAVTGAEVRRLRINATVPQSDLRDSIFYTKEREKDSGVYELARTKDDFRIILVESPPSVRHGPFSSGAYAGLALHANTEPGEDCIYIEVGVPTQYLEEVVKALKQDKPLELHISVALQSFSFEVDDALREWYHPRELFIHGSAAPAALTTIRTLRTQQAAAGRPEPENDVPKNEALAFTPSPALAPALDLRPFLGIKTALWAIATLLLLHLFK